MNAYVTLDGKQYTAPHGQWAPQTERAVVVKRLMSGGSNATFGPAPLKRWSGVLRAKVSPASGYGSIVDLRTTCEKMQTLSFTDHYGTSYTVIVDRTVSENSFAPVWDASSNSFEVNLTVIEL